MVQHVRRHKKAMTYEIEKDGFTASDDPARIDLDTVHGFLHGCYWAESIPRETVEKIAPPLAGHGALQ